MTTSASGRSAYRFGGFLSVILLVTMALLVAAPSTSEAKTQLWLYPDSDDPRAGGHVVTDGVFTLVVENRGRGGDDIAKMVSLVVAVNDTLGVGRSQRVGKRNCEFQDLLTRHSARRDQI